MHFKYHPHFFSPNDKHSKCLKGFVLFMGCEKSLCILFSSQIRIYDGNYVSLDKLTLKIPWKNLYGEAVVATLEGLYLLVVPGASMLFYTVIILCHCNEVKLFPCEVFWYNEEARTYVRNWSHSIMNKHTVVYVYTHIATFVYQMFFCCCWRQ